MGEVRTRHVASRRGTFRNRPRGREDSLANKTPWLAARATAVPAAATLFILAAQVFRFPSTLKDAATGEFLPGYSLEFPWGHLLSAPLSAWADQITFNGLSQHKVLLLYILLGYWFFWAYGKFWGERKEGAGPPLRRAVPRALGGYALYLAAALAFLSWAMLYPRPAARLRLGSPEELAVDFHSHTRHSHDGRASFTPRANMDWHRDMGFKAGFITDHNLSEGSEEAAESWKSGGKYRPLRGVEVSLHRTHVVVLGNRVPIDNREYDGSLEGVERFLGDCRKRFGGLAVLSLPEYWRHHWERLDEMAGWGAAGIEIANGAPKALDFPREKRREVVELCRRRNLFMAGVSDSHGWGRAAYAWSVMRIPRYQYMVGGELERAVLETLVRDGFTAVRVVERAKQEPLPLPWLFFDPLLGLWAMARAFTLAQAAVSVAWVWAAWVAAGLLCRAWRDGRY